MTIPLSTVVRVAEQLLRTGRVSRGYIGVGLQAVRLPSGVAAQVAPQDVGLIVVSLDEGAPASAAGIQLGDVIVSFDGKPVSDPSDVLAQLSGERVGTSVAVTLVRGGQVTSTSLTIGERPRTARR
jgi:S1-C subfamily serine protease